MPQENVRPGGTPETGLEGVFKRPYGTQGWVAYPPPSDESLGYSQLPLRGKDTPVAPPRTHDLP